MTVNLQYAIQKRIMEALESEDPALKWCRPRFRRHNFLPLYQDWIQVIGISPDLTFIRWLNEAQPPRLEPLQSPYWQRIALVAGAGKYPELKALLPSRPQEAESCTTCKGQPLPPPVQCICGGLGWLIPGEDQALPT